VLRFSLAAAVFAVTPSLACASAIYTTTIDYTPDPDFGWSSSAARGDRIVIEWRPTAETGTVGETDLDALTFHLYGDGALIWTDVAIVGGVFQPIDGQPRENKPPYMIPNGIVFDFDLDAWALDPQAGLIRFDNDGSVEQADGASDSWNLFLGWDDGTPRANALLYDAYGAYVANSTRGAIDAVSTTRLAAAVPLPGALPLALVGMAGLALAARRRG